MEPVIKSKEKCLHCIYGVTGECSMYDDFGLPEDGDKCYNFMEADEEEKAEGQRLADGELTIDDCIPYLSHQQEFYDPLLASGRTIQKSISLLREYKEQQAKTVAWSPETEERLRAKLRGEYEQANSLVRFASHATKPLKEDLINEETSVEDMMKWIKKELGV